MIAAGQAGLILAVCLILGHLGPLDPTIESLGAAIGLGAWAAGVIHAGRAGGEAHRLACWLRGGIATLGIPISLAAPGVPARLALVILIAVLIEPPGRAVGSLFLASNLAWLLVLQHGPGVWIFEVEVSRLLSAALGSLTSQQLDLGPSGSGLNLLSVFLFYLVATTRRDRRRLFWRTIALTAVVLVFMALLPRLGSMSPRALPGHSDHAAMSLSRAMFGWLIPLFAALCCFVLSWGTAAARRPASPGPSSWATVVPGTAVGLAVLLALSLVGLEWQPAARRPGKIVLMKSPAFDTDIPVMGRYGIARSGMFGLLSRYLALDGHETIVHEGPPTPELLAETAVLIVALPVSPFETRDLVLIRSFVEQGGSLLVMGDHTDLLGVRRPLNQLVQPWRIRFRFDSAYPAVRFWHGCLGGPGSSERIVTGIGTGASLQIHGTARPVVIGRYAHADTGDRANTGAGAYLGNYAYDEGEQLGDLVLAAESPHGDGRVLVLGDTSSFQNIGLPYSYAFVATLIDDLARPVTDRRRAATGAALASAALGVLVLLGHAAGGLGLSAAVMTAAIVSSTIAGSPLDRLPQEAPVALVDAGHLNDYSLDLWKEESIGGLLVNLQRSGYLPLIWRDGFEARAIGGGTLPVVVEPRASLTPGEVGALADHLSAGGDLLLAAGTVGGGALEALLSRFGLSITALPLGPFPVEPLMDRSRLEDAMAFPQFRRAYPVQASGAHEVRSHYRAFDRDVVLELRTRGGDGGGRLLVVGDPDFLTDRILENEQTAWEGNVLLLANLLSKGGGV